MAVLNFKQNQFKWLLTANFTSQNYKILRLSPTRALSVQSPAVQGFPNFTPRQRFELPPSLEKQHWNPKHMGIQFKVMEGKLRTVDLVIEVHDARVALTGRNPAFRSTFYAVRPHILVMNKMDLIKTSRYKEAIEAYYKEKQGITNICWTNCTDRSNKDQWDNLLNQMLDLLRREHRFNRTVRTEYQVMVVGIPNTGKSSLINALRHHILGFQKASIEGARPGVTIRVQNRVRILDRPPIYLLDTPGVLSPWAQNVDSAMKLAICNLVLESTTNPYYVADYLLYYMNKYEDFSYMKLLRMDAPSDDIKHVLLTMCKLYKLHSKNYTVKGTELMWDMDTAAKMFVELYRKRRIKDRFLDRELIGFKDSCNS